MLPVEGCTLPDGIPHPTGIPWGRRSGWGRLCTGLKQGWGASWPCPAPCLGPQCGSCHRSSRPHPVGCSQLLWLLAQCLQKPDFGCFQLDRRFWLLGQRLQRPDSILFSAPWSALATCTVGVCSLIVQQIAQCLQQPDGRSCQINSQHERPGSDQRCFPVRFLSRLTCRLNSPALALSPKQS